MNLKNLVIAIAAGLAVSSASAQTTDNGTIGDDTTGQLGVELIVADAAQVTGLNGFDFGTYGPSSTGALQATDQFCIYRNGGDGYKVKFTNTNGAAADVATNFHMVASGTNDEIMYSIKFGGLSAEGGTLTAAAGVTASAHAATSASWFGDTTLNCSGNNGVNAEIQVDILETEIREASTGNYTDTITMLVTSD